MQYITISLIYILYSICIQVIFVNLLFINFFFSADFACSMRLRRADCPEYFLSLCSIATFSASFAISRLRANSASRRAEYFSFRLSALFRKLLSASYRHDLNGADKASRRKNNSTDKHRDKYDPCDFAHIFFINIDA